jgi:hypothetical protein
MKSLTDQIAALSDKDKDAAQRLFNIMAAFNRQLQFMDTAGLRVIIRSTLHQSPTVFSVEEVRRDRT